MSKVVHLTAEAHGRAKEYCERHGLKMSHWVAELIAHAVREGADSGGGDVRRAFSARRPLPQAGEAAPADGALGAAHAAGAPPFWVDGPPS